MKRLLLAVLLSVVYTMSHGQTITSLKEKLVQNTSVDSMYRISMEKVVPFKDSGIVVIGYRDSIVNNQSAGLYAVVTAFDKDLNIVWAQAFSVGHIYATLSLTTDDNYSVYATIYDASGFTLKAMDSSGAVILDADIENDISTHPVLINDMACYKDQILVGGNIYNSSKSFSPFLALYDKNGNFIRKIVSSACVSRSVSDQYACSILSITNNGHICFTHQVDTFDNYAIACYDSSLNEVWSNSFSTPLGYSYNLATQGDKVVFVNMNYIDNSVVIFKFNALTGSDKTEIDPVFSFYSTYSMLVLPTPNKKYLNFGNYTTTGGFDNAIDYFDDNYLYTSAVANAPSNTRNRVSSACIVGNYIYTVAIRFVDKYCYPNYPSGYDGLLWIKKFNTDFMGNITALREVSNSLEQINSYPNPFADQITISVKSPQHVTIEVYDQLGNRVPADIHIADNTIQIDTKSLPGGIYFIKQYNENSNTIGCVKMIKR